MRTAACGWMAELWNARHAHPAATKRACGRHSLAPLRLREGLGVRPAAELRASGVLLSSLADHLAPPDCSPARRGAVFEVVFCL